MNAKKQKLIKALNLAINALKNDTVHYSWQHQNSCNCGIVAQAILGKNKQQINSLWANVETKLEEINIKEYTWRNGVKHLCPITGEPLVDVFSKLFESGLSKEDIVHLEYMN